MRTVVLDNEAVQALLDVDHPKHRAALAPLAVVAQRKRRAVPIDVVVPTAVRVEAGWDRSRPAAAVANRLRIRDLDLDGRSADRAAAIRAEHGVSVADAHLGAVVLAAASAGAVAVVTSDPSDVRAMTTPAAVDIVSI